MSFVSLGSAKAGMKYSFYPLLHVRFRDTCEKEQSVPRDDSLEQTSLFAVGYNKLLCSG